MPSKDPWDELPKGEHWTWSDPGEELVGDVISKSIDKDFNGNDAPCLGIRQDDGTDTLLTAGQAQLKAKLLEARPAVGDRIKITLDSVERRTGGKTLKHFTVKLLKGQAKSPAAQAAASSDDFDRPTQPPARPQPDADPVYDDEEPF